MTTPVATSSLRFAAALAFLGLAVPPASAQLVCGGVVNPGDKITLTADVGPCTSATDPAIQVTGPATLDLAGFRVLCDPNDPPTGVRVDGKSAKVLRGSAHDCVSGLDLTGGEGKHKVEDFLVEDSTTDGVAINSDKNKLRRVASVGSGDDGFDVDGNGNKIEDAESVGSGGEGFEVGGDGNKFKRIVAASGASDGLVLSGDDNQVKECRMARNDDGVDIEASASGSKLEKCMLARNSEAGAEIEGSGSKLKKNLALDNGVGIQVRTPGANNVIEKTTALGHGGVDLEDENAACGTNTWKKNTFGTSEADGVPSPACIQ